MKKISFSERYGMQQAVLDGTKTMTRRIIPLCERDLKFLKVTDKGEWLFSSRTCLDGAFPAYKIGEEVAVAQRYEDAIHPLDWVNKELYEDEPGWKNKMFVRADLMPHHIRITDIRVERLQDISDEDCLREGVEKAYLGYYVNGLKTKDWEKESHVEKDGKTYKLFPTPAKPSPPLSTASVAVAPGSATPVCSSMSLN